MKINYPLVSVLMTAYNRELYIAEAIESVLAQDYENYELIIVDDCSSDNTVEIAKSYQKKDSRIQVYVNEKNLGDYPNRNRAASYAKGYYLKYLDSDDLIYPWGLRVMVYCMEKFPVAGFGLMSYGLPLNIPYPILTESIDAFRFFYFKFALISMGPSGAIFRKDAFENVKGFSGKPYVGDSEMWIKMASKYSMVRMPLDLVWWREHNGQQINEGRKNNYYLENQYNIFIDGIINEACPLPLKEKRTVFRNLQNVRIRTILFNYFFKLKINRGIFLLKRSNLSVFDLWKCFRKNKYNI